MRATLQDVAKKVGLSTTTVSLVLNNKPNRISEATKEKILAAARELNYRPNHIAVSMVTKETKTIGLILPDISNLYFSELARVIEDECNKHGYNVLYGNTHDSVKRDFEYLNIFLDRNVDAIIMSLSNSFGLEDQKQFSRILANTNVPIIMVDRTLDTQGIVSVVLDHKQGGYLATKHLLSLGHRRIGCVSGPANVPSAIQRLEGYKQALLEEQIPFDPDWVYTGDFRVESGSRALPYLLGQNVSAIFACNDMMALGIYRESRLYNLRIPNDLSLVGFDDIFLSDFLDPPLTTVAQPIADIGKECVKQAMVALNNEATDGGTFVFKPVLKVRGSCRPYQNN